ncbi:MAG: deoxyribodipyrimidine photo-lyase [Chromatiales bacterium]|jgi:deoxyribodipyrimidine photo-lyase
MSVSILWLRNDLRLHDNPALQHARQAERLLPVFIHDPTLHGDWSPGAASNWWLHHSLKALDAALRQRGSALIVRTGSTKQVLQKLIRQSNAERVCWNRRYELQLIQADRDIKSSLQADGIEVRSFNAGLLFEPWDISKQASTEPAAYKVFTAYWKACLREGLPTTQSPTPRRLPPLPKGIATGHIDELGLLPDMHWYAELASSWQPGEAGALGKLKQFVAKDLSDYEANRDLPARSTSTLSPHLHFGEISPRRIAEVLSQQDDTAAADTYLRQLVWREFAHHLLYHFPHTDKQPLNPRFAAFPWRDDYARDLQAWQRGQTGIPLVDAGMRQLWQTGWMHNRVRMVVASFLTKNLLIPWQEGAAWFWDTLVDADLANNTMGWQWVAGSGADAAPYFRIFNPVLQGEKFDPEGEYVKRWLPELKALPKRYIHQPWTAPSDLKTAIADYPATIVDLKQTRERALVAYRQL